MDATLDYYKILQVRFDAEKADIVSSYKRLCKLYHPDISSLPHAQELMAQINIAFDTLRDDKKRQAYNKSLFPQGPAAAAESSTAEASSLLSDYFDNLLQGNYEQAYQLLCESDRHHVNSRSFVQWRQTVQNLYGIREFSIRRGQYMPAFNLAKNRAVSAVKFYVEVLEKDHASGRLERYCFTKYVVFEHGNPGIYLGYRDLNEISRQFGSRAREREKDLMRQHWQEHLRLVDRLTNLPTKAGLLEQSKRELYRVQRYGSPLVVTVLCLRPEQHLPHVQTEQYLEKLAELLKKNLRLTDMPAYLGDGIFAVLFCELKKRHTTLVIERLLKTLETAARAQIKGEINASYAYEPYSSGALDPYLQRLCARLEQK